MKIKLNLTNPKGYQNKEKMHVKMKFNPISFSKCHNLINYHLQHNIFG